MQSDGFYFCKPITLACDLRCDKAWGHGIRPQLLLSTDEDDYAYFSDDELDVAPIDPGTYEGDHGKPTFIVDQHNKWCCRACERCRMVDKGAPIVLWDLSKRGYNIPSSEAVKGRIDFTAYWTKSAESGEFYISTTSLDEATKIADWYRDLYKYLDGAEIKLIEGIVTPVHGDVIDYAFTDGNA